MSELTFANLYLFRSAHDYRLTLVGDAVVVLGKGYGGGPDYLLPPLNGDRTGAALRLLADGLTLYADDSFTASLPQERLLCVEDRDSADYLYLRSELAELPGNRFHKKKNRINYFLSRHPSVIEPWSPDHREGCYALIDLWLKVRGGMESTSLLQETEATREALELAPELGLEGPVVLTEEEVTAFALGERLNRATSVLHFEKGNPFMEGVYQLADQEFSRLFFTDCDFVNREQDLGEPGLRESKLSYHPTELVKKFVSLASR